MLYCPIFTADKKMQIIVKYMLLSIVLTLSLTNCTSYDLSRKIVQQGNLLPSALVDRLKVGMSKEDTATLLGTSQLSDTFNENRWDYAYTWRRGSGPLLIKNLVIYFNHGRIARIERMS